MFAQDWPEIFKPMEMYPMYPFPEKESDLVRTFIEEYQAPVPVTGQVSFFAPERVVTSEGAVTTVQAQADAAAQVAAQAAPAQATGLLGSLPSWALWAGAGGLLLLLRRR
jgi:hypothetical protein